VTENDGGLACALARMPGWVTVPVGQTKAADISANPQSNQIQVDSVWQITHPELLLFSYRQYSFLKPFFVFTRRLRMICNSKCFLLAKWIILLIGFSN